MYTTEKETTTKTKDSALQQFVKTPKKDGIPGVLDKTREGFQFLTTVKLIATLSRRIIGSTVAKIAAGWY